MTHNSLSVVPQNDGKTPGERTLQVSYTERRRRSADSGGSRGPFNLNCQYGDTGFDVVIGSSVSADFSWQCAPVDRPEQVVVV